MDKLIVDHNGKAVISNDGATIMKLLDIVHPAAKTLVDIAKSQDAEVGDGTTSVVILAGVHPRIIVRAVRTAAKLAVDRVKELSVKINNRTPEEQSDMFCAGRVPEEDLRRTQRACGGAVLSSNSMRDVSAGSKMVCCLVAGCPAAQTCTLILRGGAEQFLEETERSLHDAIMIVRRTIKNDAVVAAAAARAFEAIPRQLADNAGLDATSLLNKLRQKHHQGEVWYGIDIQNEDITDNFKAFVWEPAVVKINAITAACEAAAQVGDNDIIDDKAPSSENV
ncbi:T-complex protein subunit eta [Operophtera brumata]|uniref:T-complex protein subunit eta n=1 Tax=Operophtera brumata TaxID=104452 RepID=A0A0L7LMR2_OPEBR|nr:T-complex protein subunit eta [Operophtera brumata]